MKFVVQKRYLQETFRALLEQMAFQAIVCVCFCAYKLHLGVLACLPLKLRVRELLFCLRGRGRLS